jgi:hypothetical protein
MAIRYRDTNKGPKQIWIIFSYTRPTLLIDGTVSFAPSRLSDRNLGPEPVNYGDVMGHYGMLSLVCGHCKSTRSCSGGSVRLQGRSRRLADPIRYDTYSDMTQFGHTLANNYHFYFYFSRVFVGCCVNEPKPCHAMPEPGSGSPLSVANFALETQVRAAN